MRTNASKYSSRAAWLSSTAIAVGLVFMFVAMAGGYDGPLEDFFFKCQFCIGTFLYFALAIIPLLLAIYAYDIGRRAVTLDKNENVGKKFAVIAIVICIFFTQVILIAIQR